MKILNASLQRDLDEGVAVQIELGSGGPAREGLYAVDRLPLEGVDAVADLNEPLAELPDDCASLVRSRHVLEHVENLELALREMHRITRPDGRIVIVVPHFSNPYYYSDPTHVRFFGLYSMHYFVAPEKQRIRRKVPAFYSDVRFEIERLQIRFYRLTRFDRLIEPLMRRLVNRTAWTQDLYERRLSPFFHAWEIRWVLRPDK